MSDEEALRELSTDLFGQALRLEVMITIALSDGLICQKDVVRALGLDSPSKIQTAWTSLKNAHLLTPAPDARDDSKRRWMQRAPSKVWDWVLELAEQYDYQPPNVGALGTGAPQRPARSRR